MKLKKLILICGKAASGKDSLANEVSKQLGIPMAVSFTTRDKRQNEIDNVHYKFITDTEFKMKMNNNEIIEHTSYNIESENRVYTYGLTKEEIEKSEYVMAIVNPHGLSQLLNSQYKDKIVSILIDCNDRQRLARYLQRDENVNVEEMIDRYGRDKRDFDGLQGQIDYVVYNEGLLEKALQDIKSIIVEEMLEVEL